MRSLILMGSARTDGDTATAAKLLASHCPPQAEVVDLMPLGLQAFQYGHSADDGFLSLVEKMIASDRIVFATPLYWYAMSGVMKTLFDRLTDVLMDPTKRPLGRALTGRDVWALVVGNDQEPPNGLAEPFQLTASYVGMRWRELCYIRSHRNGGLFDDDLSKIVDLSARIMS